MQHERKDSAMTHSTRKSYKEKYLACKQNIASVDQHAEDLATLAEFQALAEHQRSQQHKVLQEVAEFVVELVELMDSKAGQLGFKIKDVRKPVDANLPSMDGLLIARRTRDILKHASSRIAVASLGLDELRDSVNSLTTGVQLLQPTLQRSRNGYLESYVIGKNPTDREIEEAQGGTGKNPRTLDYSYETDYESSESEDEEDEDTQQMSTAVVSSGKATGPRMPAKKPAGRRLSDEIEIG